MRRRYLPWLVGFFVSVQVAFFGASAFAFVKAVIQVKDFTNQSELVFTATVESIDAKAPSMVLKVTDQYKGKAPFTTLTVNLTGDNEQGKWTSAELQKRLAEKLPIVVFCNPKGTAQARFKYHAFLYTNGTWFQMFATEAPADDKLAFKYRHCEPFLRRVFKGTTAEMQQTVKDAIAGKTDLPKYDDKEPEGIGPEVDVQTAKK